jgi:hypothetical protein
MMESCVTLPMRRLRQLISQLFTEEESFVLLIGIKLIDVILKAYIWRAEGAQRFVEA